MQKSSFDWTFAIWMITSIIGTTSVSSFSNGIKEGSIVFVSVEGLNWPMILDSPFKNESFVDSSLAMISFKKITVWSIVS